MNTVLIGLTVEHWFLVFKLNPQCFKTVAKPESRSVGSITSGKRESVSTFTNVIFWFASVCADS